MLKYAELFTQLLESKNLIFRTGEASDGDVLVTVPYSGKEAKIFFSGDDGRYLSIYLVYESVPKEKIADMLFLCNELNKRYKWVTFYLDDEFDLVAHDDAIISADNAADEAFELLLRILNICDECKPEIMKAIYA